MNSSTNSLNMPEREQKRCSKRKLDDGRLHRHRSLARDMTEHGGLFNGLGSLKTTAALLSSSDESTVDCISYSQSSVGSFKRPIVDSTPLLAPNRSTSLPEKPLAAQRRRSAIDFFLQIPTTEAPQSLQTIPAMHHKDLRTRAMAESVARSMRMPYQKQHEEHTWREKLGHVLESPYMHALILILVLIDFSIVLVEITAAYMEQDLGMTTAEWFDDLLHWASVAILGVFALENALKFVAFGYQYYLKHPMHLLDLAIVTISLTLLLTLHRLASEMVGLLIILRLWRVVRIIEAAVIATSFRNRLEQQRLKRQAFRLSIRLYAALERLRMQREPRKFFLTHHPEMSQGAKFPK